MGRNQLTSVCKRLPGWILAVVPVLTISSAASCPWVRVSGYAVVRDQPDHEAAGRISNWTKDYLHKTAVACRVSCMSRRARDDSLLNLVGASSTYAFGVGWGADDELLAWCRERFAPGMPRHPAADARGRCLSIANRGMVAGADRPVSPPPAPVRGRQRHVVPLRTC